MKADPGRVLLGRLCALALICFTGCRSAHQPAEVLSATRSAEVAVKNDAGYSSLERYDAELLRAVRSRWLALLESSRRHAVGGGRVVFVFSLHPNGKITDLVVKESTVGEALTQVCSKAILDPSPYERWPEEMRERYGKDPRKITFTFYYE